MPQSKIAYSRLSSQDLSELQEQNTALLATLPPKSHIFVTGGTGFFGRWLLAALATSLDPQHKVAVLTRSSAKFLKEFPEYADHSTIRFVDGDVRDFATKSTAAKLDDVTHIIHAGTPADATLNRENPQLMLDIILDGAKQVNALVERNPVKKLLLVSSGAVYGSQPPTVKNISESHLNAPDTGQAQSAYGEGKRMTELMFRLKGDAGSKSGKFDSTSARAFAFAGPHLSLDGTFAVGNFVRDAMKGEPIRIDGDGTPLRSYLYPTDLVHALLLILLNGRHGEAYNVGSEAEISIRDLAVRVMKIAGVRGEPNIRQAPKPNTTPARYVPSVEKLKSELGFKITVDLDQALKRMFDWNQSTR